MDPTWTASDAAPPPAGEVRPFYPEPASLAQVPSERRGNARTLVVAGALVGVTALALAVAMIGGPPTSGSSSTGASKAVSSVAALPPTAAGASEALQPVPYPSIDASTTTTPTNTAPAATPAAPAQATTPPAKAGTKHSSRAAPANGRTSSTSTSATPAAGATASAEHEVCLSCGTVTSVKAVTVAGQTTGVGAVGGGAAGALVGSQVAGRGNHTLGAILGAIGGGLLGHHVEKQARSTTAYDVKIHMEDGTWRTVRQAKAPKVGARVDVSGQTLRPLSDAGSV